MGARQLQPLATERAFVLVEPVQLVALLRLVPCAFDVDAPEVHLGAAFTDRELDRAPAKQMERSGVRFAGRSMVARVDRRESATVAIHDQAGQGSARRR